MRIGIVIGLMAVIAGCSGLPNRPHPEVRLVKPPATADEAIAIARDFTSRGRWSDAIQVLESASRRFAGSQALDAERRVIEARWEYEERSLEDQILVGDGESQRAKIALLEKLSLAQPDDLIVISRRIYWKEVLAGKLEALTDCAERHALANPALARRCVQVAAGIPSTPDIEQRLARVNAQLRASEEIAAERRRINEEKERHARARVLLDNAKQAIDSHEYRRALDTLEQVAELQPNNHEVSGLREEAWSMISPQVEALIKLGDHLYLDEQLDAAVATWQAALTLKPGDEEILARIERAKTVLKRLDALRRQQNSPLTTE